MCTCYQEYNFPEFVTIYVLFYYPQLDITSAFFRELIFYCSNKYFFSSLIVLLESFWTRGRHLLWMPNMQSVNSMLAISNLGLIILIFLLKGFLVLIKLFFREAFSLLQECWIWRPFKRRVLNQFHMHKSRGASLFRVSLTNCLKKQSPTGVLNGVIC